ncbi:cell division septal protein FtsQ [Alkalihalobacillus xiaoxiensis]|uniref:Cell division septal protein FtsQ n=1 Tax=Shouchella xiaoxiensis TaxID=766895 RepID=A0ABS2SRX1_9BACI|nr:hypothetical protein [Shouchella xiaoxiensis]MBM7838273.1 cell division septal protein FtsQ [Shouchella xiaoxiensis]
MNEPLGSRKETHSNKKELPARANYHKNKRTRNKNRRLLSLPQFLFGLFFLLVGTALVMAGVILF